MANIKTNITELIGHTPLLELSNYEKNNHLNTKIIVKLEYYNPNESVKDRTAWSMIETAEKQGLITPGDTLVETTSGNTGIGVAAIAASKGYKFRVYLQDHVSVERFRILEAFGCEIIRLADVPEIQEALIQYHGDFVQAVHVLEDSLKKEEHVFFLNQLVNPSNPHVHEITTGPEIWEDTDGTVDIFVATVGTGGTITGTGNYLKNRNPDIQVIAVQPGPDSMPSDNNPLPEMIDGIHPFDGMPPESVPQVLDVDIIDEVINIETYQAYEAAREVAKSDGIMVGTSAGAAIYAAKQIAERAENAGKTIVVIVPDSGSKYLSTNLYKESAI